MLESTPRASSSSEKLVMPQKGARRKETGTAPRGAGAVARSARISGCNEGFVGVGPLGSLFKQSGENCRHRTARTKAGNNARHDGLLLQSGDVVATRVVSVVPLPPAVLMRGRPEGALGEHILPLFCLAVVVAGIVRESCFVCYCTLERYVSIPSKSIKHALANYVRWLRRALYQTAPLPPFNHPYAHTNINSVCQPKCSRCRNHLKQIDAATVGCASKAHMY